jgi:hypothetical protein
LSAEFPQSDVPMLIRIGGASPVVFHMAKLPRFGYGLG